MFPVFLPEEDYGNRVDFFRLDQGQGLEQLIQGTIPPGKATSAFARMRKCIFRIAK
jgi:hypothetical protein